MFCAIANPGAVALRALSAAAAERVRGVDAEDADLAGEEAELLEREAHGAVVGVALDLGVELRHREPGVDHVALELHDVDAVGREAAERLVERRRDAAHAEDEAGEDGASLRI